MNCKVCKHCIKGYFDSRPDDYVCIGFDNPFSINDRIVSECSIYEKDEWKNDDMAFPKQFEYVDILRFSDSEFSSPKYVTILDEFAHHYTGDKYYRIRIEHNCYIFNDAHFEDNPVVEYKTVCEKKLREIYGKRKED